MSCTHVRLVPTQPEARMNWTNWAGNQQASAARVVRPGTTTELADAVKAARADGLPVKALGSGHSFTGAAATNGVRVDLSALTGTVRVDRTLREATVPAGMPLHVLNQLLAAHGLALPNLGDIDAQTISGATATGTHGTGAGLGCLS